MIIALGLRLNPNVSLHLTLVFLTVINSQVSSRFSMLDPNDIAAIEIVILVLRHVSMLVGLNGPFFGVLADIGLIP